MAAGATGVRLLSVLGTEQLPLGANIVFDTRLALISLGMSVLLGLVLALPIIWFSLHARLASVLQAESRGGTVSREAGPMKHGTTVIAFVEDPDGYKIEFIQRTTSHDAGVARAA